MTTQEQRSRELAAEQAAEWFVEHRTGELSARQKREFMRWLRASPLHVVEYLGVVRTAREMGAVAKGVRTPSEELLAEAGAEIGIVPLHANVNEAPRRQRTLTGTFPLTHFIGRRTGQIAALTAGLCLIFAGWTWMHPPDHVQHYAAAKGQKRTVKLADYTVVQLNSDSQIGVEFEEHRRLIRVERGQALFEVARDLSRPFQVRAGESVIQDVGTIFDVSTGMQGVTVTVLEGRVAVWGIDKRPLRVSSASPDHTAGSSGPPQSQLNLVAGEQASIDLAGSVLMRHAQDVQQDASWLRPQIVFERESIAEVAAEFSHHNPIQIEITDPKIGAMTISGVFHSYDVPSLAAFLNGLPGVRAQMRDGQLRVGNATE